MDMSASKVKDIIGDCPRFCSPDCEPYGYYIVSEENNEAQSFLYKVI